MQTTLADKSELLPKKSKLENDIALTVEMTQNIVDENARTVQNQDDFKQKYDNLVAHYEKLKSEYDSICLAITEKEAKYEQIWQFIKVLREQHGVLAEFDETLWSALVEKVVVKNSGEISVIFKDGTEIKVE